MIKLLLTGFEPFGGQAINPSAELIRDLGWLKLPDVEIVSVLIPVDYETAWEVLKAKITEYRPTHVVCLGQAGGRKTVSIERVGINWMEDRSDQAHAENKPNQTVFRRKILEQGPDALFATLPVDAMSCAGEVTGVPTEVSNTAGTYLCNFILFRLLESQRTTSRRCGFIHVPYLPAQVAVMKPPPPSLPIDDLKRVLVAILNAL